MIIVLAGTVEGRQMVSLLHREAWPHTACVVSRYGAELLDRGDDSTRVNQGSLDKAGLTCLVKAAGGDLLVDATHPFASQISTMAMEVAAESKIDYVRLERASLSIPDDPLIKKVVSLEQIQEYLLPQQTVFSTLGSKHLSLLVPLVKRAGGRLVVRVLPQSRVLRDCEKLGLDPDHIVAMQGPFAKELNQQLFNHYGAQLILTKESGAEGGLTAKLAAALEMEIPIVVWARPPMQYPQVFDSPEAVLQYIKVDRGGMVK